MDEKRDEIERVVNEIYCDLDLDGQEDWDRVSAILYKAFPGPKSAPEPTAEELADDISHCISGGGTIRLYDVIKLIEADRARQREKGRQEERAILEELRHDDIAFLEERYTAVVEAARFLVSEYCGPCRYGDIDSDIHDLRKALCDLDGLKGDE